MLLRGYHLCHLGNATALVEADTANPMLLHTTTNSHTLQTRTFTRVNVAQSQQPLPT